MNAFETTAMIERKRGYYPNLAMTNDGKWECRLECGVDVLPASTPRPKAIGDTAFIALTLAVRARDKALAGVKAA